MHILIVLLLVIMICSRRARAGTLVFIVLFACWFYDIHHHTPFFSDPTDMHQVPTESFVRN